MTVIKNRALRKTVSIAVPFLLVPAVTLAAAFIFREKSYSVASLVIAALSLLLFISGFEQKKVGSRRMVITAVMTAFAVAGRFIFSPIPGVNPITAFAVLSGIYIGSQAGFFTGSLAALLSNLYAGQGVWTPFQMLSWGLIGYLAGVFATPLKQKKPLLYLYGGISAVLYSLLMDTWTVLWYNNGFNGKLYIAAVSTAAPFTAVYAVSNVLFLLLLAKPFGKKLDRIKIKYGI